MASSSTNQPPSAYPTASYTPAPEGTYDFPVTSGTEGQVASAQASYIAPPTYSPPLYVSEQCSYPTPYGAPALSYTPTPSVSYVAPPTTAVYGGAASYTPTVVETMPAVMGSPLPTTTTTTYINSPSRTYNPPLVMSPQPNGSFVAAPPSAPPPKLTEGMPDPVSVESQKQAYSKKIEDTLRHETSMLAQRNHAQKQSLGQMVQAQKAQYNLQMDQYLHQQAMAVDQQANAEMMMLQEAATAQKMALEQQAAGLTLEYQQRKAQEEMMAREYQIQKQYYDAEQKLAAQYQKQHGLNQPQCTAAQPMPQFVGPQSMSYAGSSAVGMYSAPTAMTYMQAPMQPYGMPGAFV